MNGRVLPWHTTCSGSVFGRKVIRLAASTADSPLSLKSTCTCSGQEKPRIYLSCLTESVPVEILFPPAPKFRGGSAPGQGYREPCIRHFTQSFDDGPLRLQSSHP